MLRCRADGLRSLHEPEGRRIICDKAYRADRDLPSATSIKPTTAFRAAIGTARLAYIMRVTSELLVVARAACGLCLKDTCMDERDDCERVGADLQSKPKRSYTHRTSVFRPSGRSGRMVL